MVTSLIFKRKKLTQNQLVAHLGYDLKIGKNLGICMIQLSMSDRPPDSLAGICKKVEKKYLTIRFCVKKTFFSDLLTE